jgi:fibronectin-binding autotransporter adhesin
MSTSTWNGVNGDWSDSEDWTGGVPNSSSANAVISAAGSYEVTISAGETFTVASVSMTDKTATLALEGTAALTVTGAFANSGALHLDSSKRDGGGSLTIDGTLTNDGRVKVGNSDLSAATTLTLGGLINNKGHSFSLTGSASFAATLVFTSGGAGFTSNGGDFTLSDVAPVTLNNAFTNSGSFELEGTSALTVTGPFANAGIVFLDASGADGGSLTIGGTLTNNGTVEVGLEGGSGSAPTVTLGGLINGSGANFDVFGSASDAATLAFTSGGAGFTSNGGDVTLFDVAPATLNNAFTNSGSVELEGTSALTVTGSFANSGTLDVDGEYGQGASSLTVDGTLTNSDDGSVFVGNEDLTAAATVTLDGLVNNSGASFLVFGFGSQATVNLDGPTSNSGKLTVEDDAALNLNAGGSFSQTASGSFTEYADSTFNIASGDTATLNGTTSLSGTVSGGGTLALAGGSATIASVAELSVAHWTVSGTGTDVTLDENLAYAGTFSAGSGATLTLSSGELTLIGVNDFAGATTSGSQLMYVDGRTAVSGLTIGGTTTFENANTLTQSGGDVTVGDTSGNAATLINASGGTWDIADDSGILLGSATSSIINAGLFEKTGGTETSPIAPDIKNSGTIAVTSGTLDLEGAVTGAGTDTVSGASTLEFDSTVSKNQTVDFTNSPAGGLSVVDLTDPHGFSGQIGNFASPDTVDLSGDWVFSGFSENSGGTLGTLTLAMGTTHFSLNFIGDYTAGDFAINSGTTTVIGHT